MAKLGAFPFNVFTSDTPVYDIATPLGKGLGSAVKVSLAVAVTATSVRVAFSHTMKHSDPEAEDDATNPNNYIFTSSEGVDITAQSVSVEQESPTIVVVATTEMTGGATYTVEVLNVETIDGEPLDINTANFEGIGERPNLVSAEAKNATTIDAVFSETMGLAYLTDPNSYQFSPAHISVNSVNTNDNPTIHLSISGEMLTGQDYILQVSSGLRDVALNPINNRSVHFEGLGEAPRLTEAAFVPSNKVSIVFSEPMNTTTLSDKNNYYLTGPSNLEILDVINVGSDYATIVFSEPQLAGLYTIHCTSAIKDLIGNSINPNYNSKSFLVTKASRPRIEVTPPSGTVGISPRSFAVFHIYDDPNNFSGILKSSISIDFTIGDVTYHAVINGELDTTMFEGSIFGNPLDSEGVFYKLRLLHGWPENRYISGFVSASDLEHWETTMTFSFITSRSNCLEDHDITPYAIEDLMLSTRLFGPFEYLQELFLTQSNTSRRAYANTRTCLFYAAQGKAMALVSSIIGANCYDIPLCDRTPILEMYRKLRANLDRLLREIKKTALIEPEDKVVFLKQLQESSPVEVVSAAAALFIYLVNRVNNA